MSPQLGISQNHSSCWVNQDVSDDNVHIVGTRLSIVYSCNVGKWTSAFKRFALLCGVDHSGRIGCGSGVTVELTIVNHGTKETGTEIEHDDALACAPHFAHDTISLSQATAPHFGMPGSIHHVDWIGACARPTHFDLGGPYRVTVAAPPLFDDAGRWF